MGMGMVPYPAKYRFSFIRDILQYFVSNYKSKFNIGHNFGYVGEDDPMTLSVLGDL